MTNAYKYLQTYKIMTRNSYPYTGSTGSCKYNSAYGVMRVSNYKKIPANDPAAHLAAVQNGPIDVAISATSSTLQLYRGGIITSTACGTTLNHAVNIVGYGEENGIPYWILRNSWGTNWGESGYFRILRQTTSGPGICGIMQLSSYPIL